MELTGLRDSGPVGSVRFCVPWRSDNGRREKIWEFCRAHWETVCPDIPIVEADSGSETFNRSASVNAAAGGTWDVAVILDADVLAPGEQVYAAIETAQRTGHMTLAFTTYHGLVGRMSDRVMDGYKGDRTRAVRWKSDFHESSIVAVPRELWDAVGGMDPRFEGWGQDDVAFAAACRTIGGALERIDGVVEHLFHPRSMERDRRKPTYQRAQALGKRYRAAAGDVSAMRALLAERFEGATS